MLVSSPRIFFPSAVKRKLFHGASLFNSLAERKKEDVHRKKEKSKRFDPERLTDLSNSSIKPYLNLEKIDLLKEFYQPQHEMKCFYKFVVNENVAKDIVNNIVTDDEQKKGILAEGNPGLGLITVNLINSGASRILVFDQSEIQDIALTQLISSHPEKITRKTGNMHKNPDSIILSSLDVGRQHGLPVTVIGVSTTFCFLRGLVYNFIKYQLWQNEFKAFLTLGPAIWNSIKRRKGQKQFKFPIYCIFHLLFTVEEVAKYPHDAFLPLSKQTNDDMYLIRVLVNPNAFEIIQKEEINEYFVFLKILGTSLSNGVIPILEKWLPNCGPYLISKGISMTTQVRDLSHDEAVRLYYFFKECDGYSDFKACTSHIFSRNLY